MWPRSARRSPAAGAPAPSRCGWRGEAAAGGARSWWGSERLTLRAEHHPGFAAGSQAPHVGPGDGLGRGFEAAARLSSFTRAAEELFITQSAVSRQVQALEEHLGTALFERHHRAIRLTHAGELLYRAASQALLLLTDTAARIRKGPAPKNLEVPEYEFTSDTVVKIG